MSTSVKLEPNLIQEAIARAIYAINSELSTLELLYNHISQSDQNDLTSASYRMNLLVATLIKTGPSNAT